jgi:hypothetical protein
LPALFALVIFQPGPQSPWNYRRIYHPWPAP